MYWQKETGKLEKEAYIIAFERKKGRKEVNLKDALSNCRWIAAEGFLSQKKVKEARCNSSRSFCISNQQDNPMFLLLATQKSDAATQQNALGS